MKKLFSLIMLMPLLVCAQNITADEIVRAVDRNMITRTSKANVRMTVHSRRASRTMEMISYSQGNDEAFSEYLSPPREKGTKMLKLGDDLWIYDPGTDRSIQISGNMLKQSVMGSDLSYEDMMEETHLLENYQAELKGEIQYDGRECWIIELTAKSSGVSYFKRKAYIDKERYVALYEEWYAKSGKLLKTIKASEVKRVSNRWYPTKMVFKDELKQGKGTEYIIDSIEIDLTLPAHIFSKAMLKK
ncbi:MAG: outer membrane lipoprotein-sorting protein [Candidatus Cloacimonetes bacterium]|nr:outer membrane lipoprotein-sorting protein [Candidatus Cloacimonadota bacterium]MDD4667263.1 outer membrane lipoprotein-sorting protein [Candidatus Cloacimonadota bacterium]